VVTTRISERSVNGLIPSMDSPFSLRIYVADGDPDGLRVIERANWSGKALVFPRSVFARVRQRPECELPGVYLLLGPATEGDGEALYVGEGDPVKPRLENHFANKDFWTRAVFFTAKDFLNKAHIQYLESRLVTLARAAKRVKLDNGNAPTESTLGEADKADMDAFLANLLGLLPILGVHAFIRPEPVRVVASSEIATIGETPPAAGVRTILTCTVKGVIATGYDGTEGFVVLAGSAAVLTASPTLAQYYPAVEMERQSLISKGVLKKETDLLRFTQDYPFNSPSMAAAAVLGRSSNGRVEWKDSAGRTLKELQEAQAKNQVEANSNE